MLASATFLAGLVLGALVLALYFQRRVISAEDRAVTAEARLREASAADNVEARVHGIVAPVAASMSKLESQIRDFEARRERAFGGIENQLQSLSRETVSLSNALKTPHTRGRWGELTLRRVVELAGMSRYCDFDEQLQVAGRLRPDMLVRLPGGRVIAVDAKAPLGAYQDAVNASDEPERRAALQRHGQAVARHIEQLAAKQYWLAIQPAPELVILFLPGDHFLTAALEAQPALLESSIAQKVVLATPATLVSALAGVAHGWRQQQVAENAEQIRQTASEVYDRLMSWQSHYGEMGAALDRAVQAYNRSVGSWEARLLPSMRKVRDMGAAIGPEPVAPELVDTAPRRPKAMAGGGD